MSHVEKSARAHDMLARRPTLERRVWLATTAVGTMLKLLPLDCAASDDAFQTSSDALPQPDTAQVEHAKRRLVERLLYSRQDIDDWLAGKAFPFCKYDAELGYLHINRDLKEGVDGSICSYRYDPSGARHTIAFADRPCRTNTYGNSFTSCEQVSDGETWQEVLAAHLGEPLRNFGIGGYSVYQAYLRMVREEKELPAKYIVFNIFDDDHYRNLHAWQRPRFGVNRKSPNPPVPHVKADPDTGMFIECPNPCPNRESLYRMCNSEDAWKLMGDSFAVTNFASREVQRLQGAFGVPDDDFHDKPCTRRALYATTRIIELIEHFAVGHGCRVLYLLSYGGQRVRQFLTGKGRFDSSLVEFLEGRKLPYVDLLRAHAADFSTSVPNIDAYLNRYYIGHYNPLGNFFCAFAIKDRLTKLLDPPPPAYAPQPSNE
jgi:hypothetical protein